MKDFARLCAAYNGKNIVFDLPSEVESKGYSVAMKAILANEKIKTLGFEPKYSMEDAIRRTCEILKSSSCSVEETI